MKHTVRYSPRPIEKYSTRASGPATSNFLREDPAAWNLAFLSHDYDDRREHPDPKFTSLVRSSTQMILSSGSLDLAGLQPPLKKVQGLMGLPAPQAVVNLLKLRRLGQLPLYRAYGADWCDTIQRRSYLAQAPDNDANPELDFPIHHFSDAQLVLERLLAL